MSAGAQTSVFFSQQVAIKHIAKSKITERAELVSMQNIKEYTYSNPGRTWSGKTL